MVDCTVSDDGVAALKKALPGIAVSHTRAPEGYWEIVITDTEVGHRTSLEKSMWL